MLLDVQMRARAISRHRQLEDLRVLPRRDAERCRAWRCSAVQGGASRSRASPTRAALLPTAQVRAGQMQASRCGSSRWVRWLRRVERRRNDARGAERTSSTPRPPAGTPRLGRSGRGIGVESAGRSNAGRPNAPHEGLQDPSGLARSEAGARGSAAVGGGWFEVDHRCERRPSRAKLGTVGLARGDEARGGAVQGLRLA